MVASANEEQRSGIPEVVENVRPGTLGGRIHVEFRPTIGELVDITDVDIVPIPRHGEDYPRLGANEILTVGGLWVFFVFIIQAVSVLCFGVTQGWIVIAYAGNAAVSVELWRLMKKLVRSRTYWTS